MKRAISLVLVTGETCQLRCRGCPSGRKEWIHTGYMTTDMADRIMTKAKAESQPLSCCLYYYNEPLLLPNLLDLVKLTKKHGLYCLLSTNLNSFHRVSELMELEPENIIVSVSGWSQATYERYHEGGDFNAVHANMKALAVLRKPGTFLRMGWHSFPYNEHEEQAARDFCKRWGYVFTPYKVGVLPLGRVLARWKDGQQDPAEKDVAVPLQVAKGLCYKRRHWNCQSMQGVAVFPDGTVCHCMDYWHEAPEHRRMDFFSHSVNEILDSYKTDPRCVECRSMGLHVYAAQEYTLSRWSPFRWAEMGYRKLGLQHYYQRLFPKLWRRTVEGHYARPTAGCEANMNNV